ncbi:hephaestin-like [Lingula anatina]|nr:hephaestin-like [Lingula anatina]|eukprot:XP_023933086.1 hephaestin-like [Lingula anatina]
MASRPYSVHPHMVLYSKDSEGQSYRDTTNTTVGVPPYSIRTYTWYVHAQSGPGSNDPNCISSAYYSAVNPEKDVSTGLVGPLIVCRKGILDENNRRLDVDREIATLWNVMDEGESWYLDDNIAANNPKNLTVDKDDEDFHESNKFHVINGEITALDSGFDMNQCDLVAWYLLSLGGETDIHTVHFHAQSFISRAETPHRGDVVEIFPGTFETVTMLADDPGTWFVHCHVDDHVAAGMDTVFTVHPSTSSNATVGLC